MFLHQRRFGVALVNTIYKYIKNSHIYKKTMERIMIIFNFNPLESINSANNATFIFFFYTLFLVIFNVMLFFICICLFLLFITCICNNPLPLPIPIPIPLPIPEEIFIPEGTGLILVGVLMGLFEILRKIERDNRPAMVLQLEAIAVRVDNNFIHYGVIDLNDLTGGNLRLLYSANDDDDVESTFVSRNGVRAFVLLTDVYLTMDEYNAFRDQIDPTSTYIAY